MPDLKLWTVEDANAALPRVEVLLDALRSATVTQRDLLARIGALQEEHGPEAIRAPTHPAHTEYAGLLVDAQAAHERVQETIRAFVDLGVEVKDPRVGLVDFPALRGSEVVYLCWKHGEAEVTHWHPMTTGYRDRRPLDALTLAAGR